MRVTDTAGTLDLPPSTPSLTPKQERFILEYVKDLNATQAAIRAGYSEATAYSIGHENLSKPEIVVRINQHRALVARQATVDATWIREKLKQNTLRSLQAEPVLDNQGKETGVYKYAGNVANRALELLGKDLGMFTDKLEVSLSNESKQLVEDMARLAIQCCDPSKRTILVEGLSKIKSKYMAVMPVLDVASHTDDNGTPLTLSASPASDSE